MAIRPLLDEMYMDADMGEPFYFEPTIEEIVSQLPPSVINDLVTQISAPTPVYQPEPVYTPEPVYSAPQITIEEVISQLPPSVVNQLISQAPEALVQDSAPTVEPTPVSAPQQSAPQPPVEEPKASKQDIVDSLTKQILGSSDTSKWQGGVGAEDAAKDMAKIMAGIGITDISQFGKVTQTGLQEDVRPDGRGGFVNLKGQPVDPAGVVPLEMDGNIVGYSSPTGTQETYGNKATGQAVPITYSERQTGNAFGGTFEGKGNTGYRVDFDASGKPVFYTTSASSRDDIGVFAPIIAAALTPVLGPAALSLLGPTASTLATSALTGALVGGSTAAITGDSIAKGALLGGAGGAVSNLVSPYLPSLPTADVPIDFVGGTPESINDALAENFVKDLKAAGVTNVSEFITNVGGNVVSPTQIPSVAPVENVQVTAPIAPTPTINELVNAIAAQQPITPQEPVAPVENVRVTAPVEPPAPPVTPTIAEVLNTIAQAPTPVEVTAPKAPEQVSPEIINAVNAQIAANVTPAQLPPVEVTAPRVEAPTVETPKTVEQVIASIVPELVMTASTPKEPEQPQQPIIVAPPIAPTLPEVTTIAERPSTITNEAEPAPVIVSPPIAETVPPKTYTTREIIDMIRLGMLGASVLGAANQDTGPTGFPIVPVPEDWKSPTYTKDLPSVAQTQLPPIDFGNRNLLIGTQWEKFLDPNYGQVPQPVQFNQLSSMSYDRLMDILGTGRDTLPSQALSINDVISGIQNQYGQALKGTMG